MQRQLKPLISIESSTNTGDSSKNNPKHQSVFDMGRIRQIRSIFRACENKYSTEVLEGAYEVAPPRAYASIVLLSIQDSGKVAD